jgi:hypothetical protein
MAASSTQDSLLYAIAVYHPTPGKYKLPGDYDLEPDRLAAIKLENVPVTIEHQGITEAVATVQTARLPVSTENVAGALDILGSKTPHKRPIGIVITNWQGADKRWYCLFAIDNATVPVIAKLIRLGALRGVSLTHVDGSNLPLELSLCVRPARPECHIIRLSNSLDSQLGYMRKLIIPLKMSTPTPLEKAIESLSEEDRKLITARFADLVNAVDGAKQEAEAAKSQAEQLAKESKSANINVDVVAKQIQMMAEQLNPELKATYYCEPENLINDIKSMDPTQLLRATDRMICACTKQMMDLRADRTISEAAPVSRKRTIAESEDTDAPKDPLARALAETFELE